MLSIVIVILIVILAILIYGWYKGYFDTSKFIILSALPGAGLIWATTQPTKYKEHKENVSVKKADGAYEEFDKEINELDFLETEEEAKTKVAVKTKPKKKPKKVRFGGAEMQGVLKSAVETLNENGEIAEIYDNLVKNPDEEIENVLISLNDNKDKVKQAYSNLDSEKKHEVDELLEFLEGDRVDNIKNHLQ